MLIPILVLSAIITILMAFQLSEPPENEQEEIDDPTATCWHDDEYYSDTQI